MTDHTLRREEEEEDQEIEKNERNKIAFLFPFFFGKIHKNSLILHARSAASAVASVAATPLTATYLPT